jgi:WD40 repeat protein/predicted Ser/Thr protein kinase
VLVSTRLTCPRGHQWEPNSSPAGRCPVCGDAARPGEGTATVNLKGQRPLPVDSPSTIPPDGTALPPPTVAPVGDLPGYEILGEIGRGGMGVVYKARQTSLKRMVAIKMVLSGPHAGPAERARFRTEAEAVARLEHPNIVRIYEVGEHDGWPFLSLEYVGGGTLSQRAAGRPLPAREAVRLVEALARAMHYAHERGVLHRDLKPANVLLTEDGVPKITDFGLAKQLGEEGPTLTDAVMGTPAYMAPEQLMGRSRDLGPATDVYALGAVLYECLTGRPPFRGESKMETLEQVRLKDPPPPSRLLGTLPGDLDTICLKCMDKDVRQRYPSAVELADDLARFLHGEPIWARPPGAVELVWKWARRRPAVAGLLAALAVVFVTGFAAVTVLWLRALAAEGEAMRRAAAESAARAAADDERGQADRARETAERLRGEAERREARLALERALALCEQGDADRGLLGLAQALDLADRLGNAGLERAARVNLAEWSGQLSVPGPDLSLGTAEVRGVAFAPDGKAALTASGLAFTRWDLAADPPRPAPVGGVLAMAGHRARSVARSPDGRHVAVSRSDGAVRVFDLADQQGRWVTLSHGKEVVWSVAYSGDGRFLATGSADRTARVWDAATGNPVGTPLPHPDMVLGVALSPDGKALATGCRDSAARLWDVATGQAVGEPLPHGAAVLAAAFSPDGRVLATASRDGTARLWDAATRRALGEPLRHTDEAVAVAFSGDGRTLLTGSHDGTARLWQVATGEPLGPPVRHDGQVTCVALSPDGRLALVGHQDGTARLWRVPREQALGPPLPHSRAIHTVAFAPRGGRVFTAGMDAARLWDARTGTPLTRSANTEWVRGAAFAPDGEAAVTINWFDNLAEWDLTPPYRPDAAPQRLPFALEGSATAVAFTPDGKRLLAVPIKADRLVQSWDVDTRGPLGEGLTHDAAVLCLAVSGDSRLLAAGCRDRTVWLWDLASDRRVGRPLPHPDLAQAVALSPDGALLAAGCRDGTARLWDSRSGQGLPAVPQHRGEVLAVAFSPDGRRLLAGSADRTARVWDVETGLPLGPPLWHRDAVQAVAFSPDGAEILTGGRDSVAQRWRAPGGPLGGTAAEARLWAEALTGKEAEGGGWRRLDDAGWRRRLAELAGPEHAAFLQAAEPLRPLPVVPEPE